MIALTPLEGADYIQAQVDETVRQLNIEARSRATRAVNVLQNKAFEVLGQNGRGRRYGRHTASAPGDPPAPDTGNLRRNWRKFVLASEAPQGVRITARIKSDMPYAEFLEQGTRNMAPRPYKERVRQAARPEIEGIYSSL